MSHAQLDIYRDDTAVALAALDTLGRVPASAAQALAAHFADLNTPLPVAEFDLPLTAKEKLSFQRTALVEMLDAIDAVDRSSLEAEIYAALAPVVDPLFRMFVSARAEEFNAEGLPAALPQLGLVDVVEAVTGTTAERIAEMISEDPVMRGVLTDHIIPAITGRSFGDLLEAAEYDRELRAMLAVLGLDGFH